MHTVASHLQRGVAKVVGLDGRMLCIGVPAAEGYELWPS